MRFAEAIEKCMQGARIARDGWNGKDQFVYFVPKSIVKAEDWKPWKSDKDIEVWGHFDIKTTNGKVQCGWLATQSDMQADDWIEV